MKKLYEEALSEKTKYPHISWKCAYIIAKGRSYYAKDTIIYVTDQRQKYLADMLGGEQTDCRNSGGIDYERVGNIVFPTPFSKLKLINSDIEKLKHNIIINNIAVWGGMMPECFPGVDRGCDFMRDETVIEQNAIVTAEATASIAIQKAYMVYTAQRYL